MRARAHTSKAPARRARDLAIGASLGREVGEVELAQGHLSEAAELLESASARRAAAGAMAGQVLSVQRLAELALVRGDNRRAGELVRGALPLARDAWLEPHLVVRLHAVLLDSSRAPTMALARLDHAERELAGTSICPPCSVAFRVSEVKALARAGHVEAARRRLGDAERLAGMWPGGQWQAASWEARGVVRRAEGNEHQAAALLLEAADLFDQAGRPLDRDRCRSEAGAAS
jgi:hypothetical protein